MSDYRFMCGCIGASNMAQAEREKDDYYATSPIAAECLADMEILSKNIWEPACGEGHLSKVFEARGFNVKSTDLVYRGYGEGNIDFLAQRDPYNGDIITNPPYKYAEAFIEHALELVPRGNKVCMFLKLTFLEGKKRQALFHKYPPKVIWVSSSRIPCATDGEFKNSMIAYAWYIWEKGYNGETTLRWFN